LRQKKFFFLKSEKLVTGVGALFFNPGGGTLYAEFHGTLYEWDLQKNKHGPKWWIGEE